MSSDQFRARAVVPSAMGGQFPPSTADRPASRLDAIASHWENQNDRLRRVRDRLTELRVRLGVNPVPPSTLVPGADKVASEGALGRLEADGISMASALNDIETELDALEGLA